MSTVVGAAVLEVAPGQKQGDFWEAISLRAATFQQPDIRHTSGITDECFPRPSSCSFVFEFGSTCVAWQVGNDAYAYAHQQLVDLSYLWILSSSGSQLSTLLPHSVANNSMAQSGSTAGTLTNYTGVILTRCFQTGSVPTLNIEPTPTVIPNSSVSE